MKVIYLNGKIVDVADVQPTKEYVYNAHMAERASLKEALASTDYKVIKNAESLALGLPLPYNAEELHKERQALRDRINELEKMLEE